MKKMIQIRKIYLMLAMPLLVSLQAAATPASLSIEEFTISAGQTKEMLIDMSNPDDQITLVQFDMRLPEGLTINMDNGDYVIDIAGRTTWRKHSLNANAVSGIVRFLLSSSTNAVITGDSGAIISVQLTAANDFSGGDIQLENILLVTPQQGETKPGTYVYTVSGEEPSPNINFTNSYLKAICVSNWDTSGDGELSEAEAAAVNDLGDAFSDGAAYMISSLDVLQYFTGLTSISWEQLSGCYSLASIVIPKNVSSIDTPFSQYFPFENISVDLENTVYDSRNGCNAIIETATNKLVVGSSNTVIPATVTAIGNYAFYFSDIQSITIPSNVKSIGQGAFSACSYLQGISLPEGLESIAPMAFSGCRNATTILVPSTLTSIGENAFLNCGFAGLSVASGNTVYDSRNNCNAIIETATNTLIKGCNNTVIPASVRRIERDAFYACDGLTNIEIPEGVNSIGIKAFGWCSKLASVTIPSTVTSIETEAFAVCSKLTSVTINKTAPLSITDRTFPNRANATLYVPFGSKSAYEAAAYWQEFNEIVEVDNRSEQTLALAEIPTMTYGDAAYALPQKTTEDQTLTWSIGNGSVASISGNTLTIVGAGTATVTATQAGNNAYKPFTREFTLTVNKAMLTITANDCTKQEGDANPELTVSYGGFKYDDDASSLTTLPRVTTTATATSLVGTYPITVSGGSSNNYEFTYVSGTLTVTEKPAVIVVTDIAQLSDAIYIQPVSARIGGEVEVQICLKNAQAATAYIFDLVLPEGVTVATNAQGKYIDALSDRHDDHTRTFNYKGDNTYGIATLSGNSEPLTGNDGAIRIVTLAVDEAAAKGVCPILIKNASYSNLNGSMVGLPETTTTITLEDYVLGDANGNGGVDIGDAVTIVNYLVGKESTIFVEKAADTNKNHLVDIGDAVTIVNYLVGKTASLSRSTRPTTDEREPQ